MLFKRKMPGTAEDITYLEKKVKKNIKKHKNHVDNKKSFVI